MGLKEITDSAYVALCGDRVSLVGKLLIVGGLTQVIPEDLTTQVMGTGIAIIGGFLSGYTTLGLRTTQYFHKARKHIQTFGRLDVRYAKTMIKGTENKKLVGYCQLQGLYLAARRYGHLESFNEAKNEVSNNILPNF